MNIYKSSKTYKSSSELKAIAKEQLFGRYPCAISALLLFLLLSFLMALVENMFLFPGQHALVNVLATSLISILMGTLQSGNAFFYLKLTCKRHVFASDILEGFRLYPLKAIGLQAVMVISFQLFDLQRRFMLSNREFLLPSVLLMIAAGILFMLIRLMYSQVFFLLQDFPEYSLSELLRTSRKMMQGHKARFFYLTISFLPLYLLVILSFGLALLWLHPYKYTVKANFYMDLITQEGREA